jgi:ATP-binding cassette subfamily B protein
VIGPLTRVSLNSRAPRAVLRRVLSLFRPYRLQVGLLLVFIIAQAVFGVFSPFFLRRVVDDALPHRNFALLTWLCAGMLGSSVLSRALGVVGNRLSVVVGQHVLNDLRVSVFQQLQKMSLGFFTRTHIGEIISRLLNDIGGINNILTNSVSSLLQSGFLAVAYLVALLVMDWRLTIYSMLVMPLFIAVAFGVGRQRRDLMRRVQHKAAGLTTLIEEWLSVPGVLLSKTFGMQQQMADRFAETSRSMSDSAIESAMAGRWRSASRRLSLTSVPAVLYWLAGLSERHGGTTASIGTIVAFTSMMNRLVSPISSMQGAGQNISASVVLFDRVFDVLDLPIEVEDRPGAENLQVREGRLRMEAVHFRYEGSEDWALKDVSFDAAPGTTTAIVGKTGSGKTTLAYLALRIFDPQRGKVEIDGSDLKDVALESISRAIGLVSQDTYLLHASVRENLVLGREDVSHKQLVAATEAACIHDAIAELPEGYDTVVGERGYRFSGGERQRLAIARVLLRNPPILVLDEATSALDTLTERAVQSAMEGLSQGRTTIVIAHRLSTVMNADQIIVMSNGQIIDRGTHACLLARSEHYARLVAAGLGSAADDRIQT